MNTERVIKDVCPVKNVDVEITDTSPYCSQTKLWAGIRDNYPNLYCSKHCYENGKTPSGCLYESITKEQPLMPGDLCE
jgi:hypothetical protein